jgi:hypothetical protein
VKGGKPDEELYSSFPAKSLRRRLWDAVVAGKCTRCNGPHLRNACPKPRQGWEDDFEKENFFTKPPPDMKKQLRVQLTGKSLNTPVPQILSVMSPLGRCLIDTCSDVSVARRDVLQGVSRVRPEQSVLVGHLGGDTLLRELGIFQLGRFDGSPPVTLSNVFVVDSDALPAGVIALLGVADIQALNISLDAVAASPGRPWEDAVHSTFAQRVKRAFRRCFGLGPATDRRVIGRRSRPESAAKERFPAPERQEVAVGPVSDDELENLHAGHALLAETRARESE